MTRHDLVAGTALAACLFSISTVAHAQDAAAPAQQAAPAISDGDIIVTATRRETTLQSTPIAISAFSQETLTKNGVKDVTDLARFVPSLQFNQQGDQSAVLLTLRGIGNDSAYTEVADPEVAIYIDGVYSPRSQGASVLMYDMERVEVLRGPQGTLFGRNASAGLLNIVSKSPSFNPGASAELTYGNYDYWHASARVTGPITQTVAASLEGVYSRRDGFLTLVDTAGTPIGDTNNRNRYFLRGQLLIEPSSDLSIRLIADYTKRDESCCGAVYIGTSEETGTGPGDVTVSPTNRIASLLSVLGTHFPNGATPYTQDPYQRRVSITPGREYVSDLRDWGLSGEINYDMGGAKLTSITAYRDYKSSDYGDYDYATADLLYRDPNTFRQFKTFTQELRLQGSALGDALDWLVGGYYAHEKLTLRDNIRFGADYGRFAACRLIQGTGATSNFSAQQLALCAVPYTTDPTPNIGSLISATQGTLNAGLYAAIYQAAIDQGASPVVADAQASAQAGAISTGLGNGLRGLAQMPTGAGDTDSRYHQTSQNWALFTHNIVHLTDRLDLTLGLRYTHESKDIRLDLNNNNAVCAQLQAGGAAGLPGIASNGQLGSAAQLAAGILTLGCLGNSSTGLNALTPTDSRSSGEFSGTASLSYKLGTGAMVYASYSRGYKAGGYNLDRFELGSTGVRPGVSPITYFSPRTNADAATLWFEPETVNAYEIGFKLNRREWGINTALFRQEFTNFQLNTFNGTSFVVQNINGCKGETALDGTCANTKPGLVSEGVEIEAYVSPSRTVRIATGLTYARTDLADRLVGNGDGSVPLDPALYLLEGGTNSNAPRFVVTGSFAWTPPLGGSGLTGLVYVDARATSNYNTGSDLYPEKMQQGYTVANARLGVRGPNERWAIELWGQNIFNERYSQVIFNSPLQSSGPNNQSVDQLGRAGATMTNQLFSSYLAEPRTYGITLRGKF